MHELPIEEVRGVCLENDRLFLVEGTSFVRFGWPELERIDRLVVDAVWIGDCAASGGVLYFADSRFDSIVSLDVASGALAWFEAPAPRPQAVAWDEGALWVSCDDALFRVALSGEVLATVPNPATTNACDGLEATDTGLYCLDIATMALLKLSKVDGHVLAGPFFAPARYGLFRAGDQLWGGTDGFVYHPDGYLTGPAGPLGIAPFDLLGTPL